MTAPDHRLPAPFKRPLASTGASIHAASENRSAGGSIQPLPISDTLRQMRRACYWSTTEKSSALYDCVRKSACSPTIAKLMARPASFLFGTALAGVQTRQATFCKLKGRCRPVFRAMTKTVIRHRDRHGMSACESLTLPALSLARATSIGCARSDRHHAAPASGQRATDGSAFGPHGVRLSTIADGPVAL